MLAVNIASLRVLKLRDIGEAGAEALFQGLKALCECFQEFNAAGGAVLPLQTGKVLPPMHVLHKVLTQSTFDAKCLTCVLFTLAPMCLPQALLNQME